MPNNIIAYMLEHYLVKNKVYPKPLPPELQEWYCYTSDGGHCILAAIKSLYGEDKDVESFLVPAPVKAVQRVGYTVTGDEKYIVVDLPYSREIGLITRPGDDEF